MQLETLIHRREALTLDRLPGLRFGNGSGLKFGGVPCLKQARSTVYGIWSMVMGRLPGERSNHFESLCSAALGGLKSQQR